MPDLQMPKHLVIRVAAVEEEVESVKLTEIGTCWAAGVPAQPDLDAIRELEALRQAFQAGLGNHRFRFQHLFLNVVEHPGAHVRPQGMHKPIKNHHPRC